jgi:hypothetical protein
MRTENDLLFKISKLQCDPSPYFSFHINDAKEEKRLIAIQTTLDIFGYRFTLLINRLK